MESTISILGPKIQNKCGLSEIKPAKLLEKVLLINRLKPIIDSFQGWTSFPSMQVFIFFIRSPYCYLFFWLHTVSHPSSSSAACYVPGSCSSSAIQGDDSQCSGLSVAV